MIMILSLAVRCVNSSKRHIYSKFKHCNTNILKDFIENSRHRLYERIYNTICVYGHSATKCVLGLYSTENF